MKRDNLPLLLVIWLLQALLVGLTSWAPLFWDNVLLTGRIPTHYLAHWGYFSFVPEDMAGYPPLWGYYIAAGWAMMGRSLATTHWLTLPLVWMISYQAIVTLETFLARRALVLSTFTLMGLPVLLSLQAQAGPDLAMIAFYLAALNAILDRARGRLAFYLILLALVSPRGVVCCLSLFILDQILLGNRVFAWHWQWGLSKSMAFVPAALVFGIWYGLQHWQYGWWFNNPNGQWAAAAGLADPMTYLRNLGISGWRMIDFGQIVLFIGLLIYLPNILRGHAEELPHRGVLALLFLIPAIVFSLFFSLFHNPIGHRYMVLPVFFAGLWLMHELSERYKYNRFTTRVLVIWLFLITGHFWVGLYPQSIAKGWDGTLCHLSFLKSKTSALEYLKRRNIPLRDVGATFPNLDAVDASFLNGDTSKMAELNLGVNRYIFYTNASNEFEPEVAEFLEREYQAVFTSDVWPAKTVVYARGE